MKILTVVIGLLIMTYPVYAEQDTLLKNKKDKVSYAIGMDIGKNLKKQPIEINPEALSQGLWDSLTDEKTLMTDQEYSDTMNAFRTEMNQKQTEQMKEISDRNKKDGEKFLAENRKKEGVVTTESGLQYKIVTEGTGASPKSTDTVTVHYKGTLIDGKEFDSSHKRGQPATFPVNGVIKGWTEALQLMKTGAKWQLFIPSELAYGERGAGRNIGPNSTLIFDVELISIKE
ncbi:MAG: FKBP-type peptidyl-prolyl cis-trans isomerase [Nitrospiraceae bacterium]|nr:MAG: FKBP-type peptidyl-prolyl cis-trans isomerase [Nitrospiraceae bacterium]